MALMNCPECKKDMSDTLNACPHCGFKIIQTKLDATPTTTTVSSNNTFCANCGKPYYKGANKCPYCKTKNIKSQPVVQSGLNSNQSKSMIKCECGKVYSIYTKKCPDCNKVNANYKKIPMIKVSIVVIIFIAIIAYFTNEKDKHLENMTVTVVSPDVKDSLKEEKKFYKIGDRGPAGGWVFYDKGNSKGGWRYLEAAPEDLRGNDKYVQWSSEYIKIGAFDTAIGTGKNNTIKIVQALGYGEYAARLCVDYRGGGKDDWFLPSMEELNLLYKRLYKKGIGNMERSFYWSSSEHIEGYHAKNLTFNDGEYFTNVKLIGNSVRPIRQF